LLQFVTFYGSIAFTSHYIATFEILRHLVCVYYFSSSLCCISRYEIEVLIMLNNALWSSG